MTFIQHQHNENCSKYDYVHCLVEAAPDVLWYEIQDVGLYQGSVYAVGEYEKKALLYEDYYGSCSWCGAWGEGGEPTTLDEVLSHSTLFDDIELAKKAIDEICNSDSPDKEKLKLAVEEILTLKND